MYRTTAVTIACVLTTATFACGDQGTEPETPTTQLLVMAGNNQIRFPGTDLVNPLGVRLTDDVGNPVRTSGIRVSWSIRAGGGLISPWSDTTNAAGLAFAEWRLGPGEGTNTVEVTAGNSPAATFDAVAALAGPIAFSSSRGERLGRLDIFVMNADGSNVIQLTTAAINATVGDNWDPSWSPDGTRIVFAREYGLSDSTTNTK